MRMISSANVLEEYLPARTRRNMADLKARARCIETKLRPQALEQNCDHKLTNNHCASRRTNNCDERRAGAPLRTKDALHPVG